MHYAKACYIVIVQRNDKETADNKNMNILSNKQHYSDTTDTLLLRYTTLQNTDSSKKCSLCFIGKREGKKDSSSPLRQNRSGLLGFHDPDISRKSSHTQQNGNNAENLKEKICNARAPARSYQAGRSLMFSNCLFYLRAGIQNTSDIIGTG